MESRLQIEQHSTHLHTAGRVTIATRDREQIVTEQPQVQTGYEQLRFHAQGGLGMVFEGTDLRLHRRVALKFMHKHLTDLPWARERFLIEAEITGRLDHPGIVPVHGAGVTDSGRPFYAMRFIRGETLDSLITQYHRPAAQKKNESERTLEFRALLTRFISVCNTLAYAHNCGIVHRDIKPENIMLGRYAETLVVDWGLALSVDRDDMARRSGESTLMPNLNSESQTGSTGGPAGTPNYMSPEQTEESDKVDRRADIYSLGVMLFKILTGQVPFHGTSAAQIIEKVRKGRFPPPHELERTVPLPLSAICKKAMALRPEDRYQTALELAKDIENWLADEPISIYHESFSARTGRWLRRHRTLAMILAGSLATFALIAVISAVGLGSYARNESALREAAEGARSESLQAAAILAAETVGREIDRRWEFLERIALDDQLIKRLQFIDKNPDDKEKITETRIELQTWLSAQGSSLNKKLHYDTMFVVSKSGEQLARQPIEDGKTIGNNFARRDYFSGLGRDFSKDEPAPTTPVQQPYHCAVYQSSSDKDLKIAFSVPVWSGKQGDPERRIIGVLGMSVVLNQFGGVLETKLPGRQTAILVDMRFDHLDKKPQRGLVIHHPDMRKQTKIPDALPHLQTNLVQQLLNKGVARLWESQQKARGNAFPAPIERSTTPDAKDPINGLFKDYADPLSPSAEHHPIAAYSSVVIPGRAMNEAEGGGPEALLDTGWIVIVQERR